MPAPVAPDLPKPLQLPLTQETLDQINTFLSPQTPEDILKWGIEYLPSLYQTTAFGLTGLVAIDMLSKICPNISDRPNLVFFDTLYHFQETYDLVEQVKTRYGVQVIVYKPEGCESAREFEDKYGEKLWETDDGLYDFAVKVEPAKRAYDDLAIKSIITGRRASQGNDRSSLLPLEIDSTGLLKLNPLFSWPFPLVQWYITENTVPCNVLLSQGYRSVGDWHSTEKTPEGESERSGRWKGKEKTECGLHKDYFEMKKAANARKKEQEAAADAAGETIVVAA